MAQVIFKDVQKKMYVKEKSHEIENKCNREQNECKFVRILAVILITCSDRL